MEKIKFRIRTRNNWEGVPIWLFGFPVIYPDNSFTFHSLNPDSIYSFDDFADNQCSPKTLGQFTGIYDTTAKEIYEGDIVKGFTKNDYFKEQARGGYVFWCERFGGWYVQDFFNVNAKLCLAQMQDLEITGNIYDDKKDLIK